MAMGPAEPWLPLSSEWALFSALNPLNTASDRRIHFFAKPHPNEFEKSLFINKLDTENNEEKD